ncbi:type I toxin-antitoxin system Ibs family toxin [Citrobacter sp. wls716]|nr:type I toxin-antitoxin system Ibs family toxin [Citrobacter sp. wls716]
MDAPAIKNLREKALAPVRSLTNNRLVSKGCNEKAPLEEGRGFNKERVMMKRVIILVVLLLLSFHAY